MPGICLLPLQMDCIVLLRSMCAAETAVCHMHSVRIALASSPQVLCIGIPHGPCAIIQVTGAIPIQSTPYEV